MAEYFGTRHAHVLRNIDGIVKFNPVSTASIFGASSYVDSTGRTLRAFEVTKDGFALLAMGFTGTKAQKWKLRHVDAHTLSDTKLPPFTPRAAAGNAVGRARKGTCSYNI